MQMQIRLCCWLLWAISRKSVYFLVSNSFWLISSWYAWNLLQFYMKYGSIGILLSKLRSLAYKIWYQSIRRINCPNEQKLFQNVQVKHVWVLSWPWPIQIVSLTVRCYINLKVYIMSKTGIQLYIKWLWQFIKWLHEGIKIKLFDKKCISYLSSWKWNLVIACSYQFVFDPLMSTY